MTEAVVFDLDGILIDSEKVWEKVRRALVAESGGTWGADTQTRIMGMSTPEWARYLAGELGLRMTPEQFARAVLDRMSEEYSKELPLLPGAVDAVRRMARRWPVGLASSSPLELINLVIDRAGLDGAFRATASSDEVARGKPAPDVYLLAAQRLGIDPHRSIAVEDSSNGLRAAAAAGYRVVAIPQPDYPPDPDALAHAGLHLESLEGLTSQALERLDGPNGA